MPKRKNKVINPLLGSGYDEVFELIKNGKVTADQFDDWIDEVRSNAYESGYDIGYETAQEVYGDGPSS